MNIIIGNKIKCKIAFIKKKILRLISKRIKLQVFGSEINKIQAVYIINLDRQIKRWNQYKKEALFQKVVGNKSLLDFSHRISAVDGKKIVLSDFNSDKVTKSYSLNDQYYVDPDPLLLSIIRKKNISIDLTKEEIAVALSHIKAWQRIVDEEKSYGLVLEDDVFFENNFAESVNKLWDDLKNKNENFDLLYLSYREVDRGTEKISFSENLFIPIRGLWWLSGYVLSFNGAKKLLAELPVSGPVDLWINYKFKLLKTFCSSNSIIYQRNDIVSDNNYSILPILSQIGVQSNKTHLLLEQRKGKNPIFVFDMEHKNSDLIGLSLSILGYRCCINKCNEFTVKFSTIIDNDEPLLFDAYIGFNSIIYNYKKIKKLYPSSLFIFGISPNSNKQSSHNSLIGDIEEYFSDDIESLLVLDIQEMNSWNRLCNFIACEKPDSKFPNVFNDIDDSIYNLEESTTIKISQRNSNLLEHDVHPWIIPIEKLESYGIKKEKEGRTLGSYTKRLVDNFTSIDESKWNVLENSFPSNLAQFSKKNISLIDRSGFKMVLLKSNIGNRKYTSASIESKESYRYGRFETVIKPVKADGVITAFFLHRNDPWQEIDFEFLGNDTTKVLINVYYNPGIEGTNNNYGYRGTPIIIDLDFDASLEYHTYAIEWEPHEIRWYVDNKLIHVRNIWNPTPIPDLPLQFYINTWISRSEELVGRFDDKVLPQNSYVKSSIIYSWSNNEELFVNEAKEKVKV